MSRLAAEYTRVLPEIAPDSILEKNKTQENVMTEIYTVSMESVQGFK